ncbi:MAG: hypothetical protein HZB61_06550 [Nitrospirae bacterium]|nr:hypothetical protein [Nitrospirota bacterium]
MKMENVELGLLIIDDDHGASLIKWSKLKKLTKIWSLYSFFFVNRRSNALKSVDLSAALSHVPAIHCRVIRKGKFSQYFNESDISQVKRHDLDFILRFGFNIIRGGILHAARYGVWSFHHDDEANYRGAPPCFWEIYKDDNVTGAMLQRLTDRLDGGIVLKKGFFKTIKTSYVDNLDEALFRSTGWPAQICIDIYNGKADYLEAEPSKTSAQIYYAPSNIQMVLFFLKTIKYFFRRFYNFICYYEQWNIGIADNSISDFIRQESGLHVRWLPAPSKNLFFADPFAVCRGNVMTILFEEYNYRYSKGCISMININGDSDSHPQIVIDAPFHMSYPYLLEYKNEVYCIPEIAQSGEVALYKALQFPERWIKAVTLIPNFAAIDSTVFYHENFWWLMASDKEINEYDNLCIWYAEALTGPWRPHAANPVKVDIRSARPAGTPFVIEGNLYRPSQDNSEYYGKRIIINRVLELTPYEYKEEQIKVLEPFRSGPYPDGLHTISSVGNKTVIDGKKHAFVGTNFTILKYKIKEMLL